MFAKPNIYCHFAQGVGEPKYLPVPSWPDLNKLLAEALDNYNEVNAAMSLVSARLRAAPRRGSARTTEMRLQHRSRWGVYVTGRSLLFLLRFRISNLPLLFFFSGAL